MEVLKAVTISISIPIFCKPYKYDDKIWIDGGCINNYPIEIFSDRLNDVIGILLDDEFEYIKDFETVDSYIFAVIKCLMKGIWINKYETFKKNTIIIKCKVDQTTWEISSAIKKKLFVDGYSTAKNYYNF